MPAAAALRFGYFGAAVADHFAAGGVDRCCPAQALYVQQFAMTRCGFVLMQVRASLAAEALIDRRQRWLWRCVVVHRRGVARTWQHRAVEYGVAAFVLDHACFHDRSALTWLRCCRPGGGIYGRHRCRRRSGAVLHRRDRCCRRRRRDTLDLLAGTSGAGGALQRGHIAAAHAAVDHHVIGQRVARQQAHGQPDQFSHHACSLQRWPMPR
ncbi:hypothetical protein D3C73_1062480 [compost metagenome]